MELLIVLDIQFYFHRRIRFYTILRDVTQWHKDPKKNVEGGGGGQSRIYSVAI